MSCCNILETLIEEAKEVMEKSKKLTTKDRKKLKKSVFCGPQKSFPCNDCAHVRAAKVYLKRSKFSEATKKKIAACINRRAKILKCNVTKKAKAGENYNRFIDLNSKEKKLYSSDTFKITKELVGNSIRTPGNDLDI